MIKLITWLFRKPANELPSKGKWNRITACTIAIGTGPLTRYTIGDKHHENARDYGNNTRFTKRHNL